MIISHSLEFIFIKAQKVAGTSTLVALAEHCRSIDIVADIEGAAKLPKWSHSEVGNFAPTTDAPMHSTLEQIRRFVGERMWERYYKVATVRNPWDRVVSLYHANLSHWVGRKKKPSFPEWLKNCGEISNEQFYFMYSSMPLDFVLRFEDLEDDYKRLCYFLSVIPNDLPKLLTRPRQERKVYQEYYTQWSVDLVGNANRKIINQWEYSFENEGKEESEAPST